MRTKPRSIDFDMNREHLLKILQISDSLFPIGGFAYSDGLETAIASGFVHDAASFEQWLRDYIDLVFIPCEGLAVKLALTDDEKTLRTLDDELTAIKPSASARAGSAMVGRRFLKAVSALYSVPEMNLDNLPVIYGAVCRHFGFQSEPALLAFAYNRLAATTSASLRVMSIGQQQAHATLTAVLGDVPAAVNKIMESHNTTIACFAPIVEIQQMNHRYLYSRLFRS